MSDREKTATVDLKVRMKEPLRGEIEAAAAENGVSMNAEAVARLQRSFVHDDLFSSREVRLWALLLAGEFHKAGVAEALRSDVDTADKAWMSDPRCLISASFSVVRSLLRDLVRLPGSDPDAIAAHIENLSAVLAAELVHAGRAKWVGEDGKVLSSGFIGDDNAR